jgi:hypothetical protein
VQQHVTGVGWEMSMQMKDSIKSLLCILFGIDVKEIAFESAIKHTGLNYVITTQAIKELVSGVDN